MKLIIIILLVIAFALSAYHVYLVFVGKRLARLVKSKDRFIWNQLKVHQAPEGFRPRRATMFLDEDHLVLSGKNLMGTYSELKRTGGLDNSLAIRFDSISNFEYAKKKESSFLGFVGYILHKILLNNSYYLTIEYLDQYQHPQKVNLSAASLDLDTFEATFADFDHKIYQKRVAAEEFAPSLPSSPDLAIGANDTVRIASGDPYPDMRTVKLRSEDEAVVHMVTTDEALDSEELSEEDDAIIYEGPEVTEDEYFETEDPLDYEVFSEEGDVIIVEDEDVQPYETLGEESDVKIVQDEDVKPYEEIVEDNEEITPEDDQTVRLN